MIDLTLQNLTATLLIGKQTENIVRQKLLRVGPSILEFHHSVFYRSALLCRRYLYEFVCVYLCSCMYQVCVHGACAVTRVGIQEQHSSSKQEACSRLVTNPDILCVRSENHPHAHHWKGCVPPCRLATRRGYHVNPIPKANLV